jgi:hypothetical protein
MSGPPKNARTSRPDGPKGGPASGATRVGDVTSFRPRAGRSDGKRGLRLLPPAYVPLSKHQRELAIASLAQLIFASMRRNQTVSAGKKGNVTSRQ